MTLIPLHTASRNTAIALTSFVLVAVGGVFDQSTAHAKDAPAVSREPRTIDLAICLDTSGSMSGLIEAAKQKLWAIVNDLALTGSGAAGAGGEGGLVAVGWDGGGR